jgi:hypothetical protein
MSQGRTRVSILLHKGEPVVEDDRTIGAVWERMH